MLDHGQGQNLLDLLPVDKCKKCFNVIMETISSFILKMETRK